jgi:hypothetical protein
MKNYHLTRQLSLQNQLSIITAILACMALLSVPLSVFAAATTTTKTATNSQSEARVQLIITKSNAEITRRLSVLATLSSKITSSTKLSTADQQTLNSEVSSEMSGLTALKTKLDADTTVATAVLDAQSIFTDYRVFALVVPQVNLVKTADQQQQTESKLSTLGTKIQTDINADQTAGQEVTNLQTELSAMSVKVAAAQTISSGIETGVIRLSPSDYDTNHAVLSGDRDQLKIAQTDNAAAIADVKVLIADLKTLK